MFVHLKLVTVKFRLRFKKLVRSKKSNCKPAALFKYTSLKKKKDRKRSGNLFSLENNGLR